MFLNFCVDARLSQLVSSPTRGINILDITLASHPDLVVITANQPSRIPSDHNELIVHISPPSVPIVPSGPPPPARRNFAKANFEEMSLYLCDVDWAFIDSSAVDCTSQLSLLAEVLSDAFSRFVPLVRRHQPFRSLPPRLLALRKERFKALRSRSVSSRAQMHFRALDRRYRAAISKYHCAVENAVVNGSRFGLSRFFKAKRGVQAHISPPICAFGAACETDREKANAFALHFASVYGVDNGLCPSLPLTRPQPSLQFVNITPEMVRYVLMSLAPKLSSGHDGIPAFALKNLAAVICTPLADLYSRSLANADIPDQFLRCTTVPVFKGKGLRSSPSNYRPINMSISICKACELILNHALIDYLESTGFLSNAQFGFRKGRSVASQMVCFTDCVSEALSLRRGITVVWLDFKAAFDSPPHPKIHAKLKHCGVEGPMLKWIALFVSSRTAQVRVGPSFSSEFSISSGLCQGSPLSATVFIIYINDLLLLLESLGVNVFAYADDIKLVSTNPLLLQTALDAVEKWCSVWQMSLAVHKCAVGFFGSGHAPTLTLANIPLPPADPIAVRDLGILIDPKLSFSPHIQAISAKARGVSSMILRAFSSRNPRTLAQAFSTFAQPILESSSVVWNSVGKSDANIIESVLRVFSLRVCRRAGLPRLNYSARLRVLGMVSLARRRHCLDLGFAHSVVSGSHFCPKFVLQPRFLAHPTRDNLRLNSALNPNRLRARLAVHRIAVAWNSLPIATRRLKRAAFKNMTSLVY
jgi:hypothetical protein